MNAAGDIVLAWTSSDPDSVVDPTADFVEASVRPAGGSFSTPEAISPQPIVERPQSAFVGGDAIDGAGEATVVWDYEDGTDNVGRSRLPPTRRDLLGPGGSQRRRWRAEKPRSPPRRRRRVPAT